MALLSGKSSGWSSEYGPLDTGLPKRKYLRPSVWWRIASHLPLLIALLIIVALAADWLGILPSWVPFSSPHITSW